ncbi:MAG: acyl-CoA dehydrogenase family protein [Nitriliruptoraceae bacterium]
MSATSATDATSTSTTDAGAADATAVTYTLTDEQRELAAMVGDLFGERATSERVRAVMLGEAGTGFDDALWAELAQYGLLGLTVPEAHGGAGASFAELAIVLEAAGRNLAPVPLLSSAVLGTEAVLGGGTEEQQARLLPQVAAGTVRLALAHLDVGGDLWAPPGVHASRVGDGWTLDGTAAYVIDGASATHLVVAAQDGDRLELFLVPGDAPGLTRTPLEVLDLTRPLATVELAGVEVADTDRLSGGEALVALHRALTAGVVALAVEQVGVIDHTLAACTAYARDRIQFGRAIGSFQAVKHRLAEMLVEAESARSAALHAARVLAAGDREELAIAAALAKAYCGEVADRSAADGIQLFGGIGFTWEHDQHLYLKRARSATLLLGDAKHHRAILADLLGL